MTLPLTRSGRPNTSGTRGGDTGVVPFPIAEEAYSKDNEQKFRRSLWDILRPLSERVSGLGSGLFALAASEVANDSGVAGANVKLALNTLDAGKQPLDASLTAYAALTTAANKGLYFTAADTPDIYDLTAAGRALLDDASASAQLTTLGAAAVAAISVLSSDHVLANVNTAQNVFNSTEDELTLTASTTYEVEGRYYIDRSAGNTAHNLQLLFAGTATFTSAAVEALVTGLEGGGGGTTYTSFINAATNLSQVVFTNPTTGGQIWTSGGGSTGGTLRCMFKGIIRSNGGGTLIPQIKYSAAPGGAPSVRANSYFRAHPIGVDTMVAAGAWA